MTLFSLIDKYKELLDRKDELSDLTSENNKEIKETKEALAKAMIEAESPKISRNGFTYSLGERVEYSKRACDEDEFFDFLRENGMGDIIKPYVNPRTLSSAMKESISALREEEEEIAAGMDDPEELPSDWLPDEYKPYISAYAFYDVSKRKETNLTAAKAKKNM